MDENNKKVLYNKEVIRQSTDAMTDLIDERAIENIKTLQAQVNYREDGLLPHFTSPVLMLNVPLQ